MNKLKVAINGFGRIGRRVLAQALKNKVNVVAINDSHGVKDAAYLLKHDSIYGNYPDKISTKGDYLIIDKKKILVLSDRNPENLPWKKLEVDVVVESTGAFRDKALASKHLKSGAKKVIISAPSKDADFTIIPGINERELKKSHQIISLASCTTNCAAPIMKIIEDNFEIKKAFLTTIHAYTSSQELVDSYNKKPRRGRSAANNLVPTSTGATDALVQVIPKLKGKIEGMSIRAPVDCGSIIDLTFQIKKKTDEKTINKIFKKYSSSKLKGILDYSEEELVSTDVIGNTNSAILDSKLTKVKGNFVKIFAWYDNEMGYSSRVVDAIKLLKK